MPRVRVSLDLPYALGLPPGDYATAAAAAAGDPLSIAPPELDETSTRTALFTVFEHPDGLDADQQERERAGDADRLLRRTNRMLRWYRAIRRRADLTERTRAQASPFRFELVGPGDPTGWVEPLRYEESGPTPQPLSVADLAAQVRAGLASGGDPPVELLFLLDAERAVEQGRFREAVLFSWSTIDSVFNREYSRLVKLRLADEWADARKFFMGFDFGLRTKMSVGMRVVAGRSFYAEPGQFWDEMSGSYDKRNKVIHEARNATEDDARIALGVARRVVQIMSEVVAATPLSSDLVGPPLTAHTLPERAG